MQSVPIDARERRFQAVFSAMLAAFSYPGRLQAPWPAATPCIDACTAIADVLIDLETSFYTPDAELHQRLIRTGARVKPPEQADYQFYPLLSEANLPALQAAPVGSYLYPDHAATLVIGCLFAAGLTLRLQGPGIQSTIEQPIDQLPAAFWTLRTQVIQYPRGWDVFLLDGSRLLGLPRTTHAEIL
ncbi:MAG: phosphonate C-P lyase system protein PhnH [Chloroflexaceae bacterium]|nr:phosphonate C-P lyase system protein PhnH [Chloroflexaceae bacterium]